MDTVYIQDLCVQRIQRGNDMKMSLERLKRTSIRKLMEEDILRWGKFSPPAKRHQSAAKRKTLKMKDLKDTDGSDTLGNYDLMLKLWVSNGIWELWTFCSSFYATNLNTLTPPFHFKQIRTLLFRELIYVYSPKFLLFMFTTCYYFTRMITFNPYVSPMIESMLLPCFRDE